MPNEAGLPGQPTRKLGAASFRQHGIRAK